MALEILKSMGRRLVEIDDVLLAAAQAELGTGSVSVTVNEALARIARTRETKIRKALDGLAEKPLLSR